MATKQKNATPVTPSDIEKAIIAESEASVKNEMVEIKFGCRNGEIIGFNVKPLLSFAEMNSFVSTVVTSAFYDDKYNPVVVPFIVNAMIIEHYTHTTAAVDIADNIAIELAYDNNIIKSILDMVSEKQYDTILSAIDEGIEFHKQEILSAERKLLNDSILRSEIMAEKAIQCIEAFTKIAAQFEGIDAKETLDIFKKISEKSEYELAAAVLAAKDKDDADNVTHLPLHSNSI